MGDFKTKGEFIEKKFNDFKEFLRCRMPDFLKTEALKYEKTNCVEFGAYFKAFAFPLIAQGKSQFGDSGIPFFIYSICQLGKVKIEDFKPCDVKEFAKYIECFSELLK
jgi:hypothetical protein